LQHTKLPSRLAQRQRTRFMLESCQIRILTQIPIILNVFAVILSFFRHKLRYSSTSIRLGPFPSKFHRAIDALQSETPSAVTGTAKQQRKLDDIDRTRQEEYIGVNNT